MKKMIAVLVVAAGVALAQETVTPRVEVDVLAVKESGFVQYVKDNWGKCLLGLTGIAGVEAVVENNDWLWHKSGGDDGKTITPPSMDASTINDNDFLDVMVVGEGNIVEVNVDYYEERKP